MFVLFRLSPKRSHALAALMLIYRVLRRHEIEAALLVSVTGWSLIWAQALSLVSVLPTWLVVGLFFAGLGLIPFCGSPSADG